MSKTLFFVLFLVMVCLTSGVGQDKIGFGLCGAYNFPLNTVGVGLRMVVPLKERIFISPQVRYFPKFNTVSEIYAGLNVQYIIVTANQNSKGNRFEMNNWKPTIYSSIGVEYNRWQNYKVTLNSHAKQQNILPNVGIGSTIGTPFIRFFAEAKYNIQWKESFGELGVLFYPGFMHSNARNNCPVIK